MINILTICAVLIGPLNTIEWADDGNEGMVEPIEFLDSLLSHWKLDETSGTRADSHSINDFTQNTSTMGFATGLLGNAVAANPTLFEMEFIAVSSSEELGGKFNFGSYLPETEVSRDFSINLWLAIHVKPSSSFFRILSYGAAGTETWMVAMNGAGGANSILNFHWRDVDSGVTVLNAGSLTTTSVWTMVTVTFDHSVGVDPTAKLYINTNAPTETTSGGPMSSDNLFPLYIGHWWPHQGKNVLIDNVSVWTNRVLVLDEIVELYNEGNGLLYENFNNP